jgi:ketosteroid isomerase-like protein
MQIACCGSLQGATRERTGDDMTPVEPLARPFRPPVDAATAGLVERFADAWARPAADRFLALLAPDVRLLQPVTPPVIGHEAARCEFGRLLRWLPDLRGTVHGWGGYGDTLLIDWRLHFTLGRAPYEMPIVDRLVVREGLIVEREAHFDSLRLMLTTVARPSAWLGYWRYRGYLPGGEP